MPCTSPGKTRRRVYEFVRQRIAEGSPPTVREVQEAFGFRAVQSARQHLETLVSEGRLIKDAGRARGYRLPAMADGSGVANRPVRLVPRLGRVQAGALQEAIEDPDGWVPVDGSFGTFGTFGADEIELFALTVQGESMSGIGILPDDTVIVRRQDTARDGEIVVALVQDEATVKRLKLGAGRVELHPENPAFMPIVIAPDTEIRILGRVVEVRRKLD
jgi:repressor LexA